MVERRWRKAPWVNVVDTRLHVPDPRDVSASGCRRRKPWVNLSDGGHIENMAIYELLRRRCKFIISVDGEADPQSTFHGHLTLVRHAQIDFGIRIEPDLTALRPDLTSKFSQSHIMMCRVHYPDRISRRTADPLPEALRHRKRARADQALPRAQPRLSAPDHARPVLRRGAVRGLSPARRACRGGSVFPGAGRHQRPPDNDTGLVPAAGKEFCSCPNGERPRSTTSQSSRS